MNTVDPAEFEKLKAEVAELRTLLNGILHITKDDEGKITRRAITCNDLHTHSLNILDQERRTLAYFGVADSGPYLVFRGDDEKRRLVLRAAENFGEITLYGNDGHATVHMQTDPDGHGNLLVHSPGGIPRAGIKGIADAGVVSVCAPDGSPRVVMHSGNEKGEVGILNAEMHMIARMSTTNENAGTIGVTSAEGDRAIILIPSPSGNGLLLYPPGSKDAGITLMASKSGSMVFMGEDAGDRGGNGISMMALPDGSGNMRFGTGERKVVLELGSDANGGLVEITSTKTGAMAQLHIKNESGHIELTHGSGSGKAVVTATANGAGFVASGGEHRAALQVSAEGGSFFLSHQEHIQAVIGPTADKNHIGFLLTNPDNTPAINLYAGPNGGVGLFAGSDGTTQLGLGTGEEGGRLTVLSELGIERATLQSKLDGGGLNLKWGGTNGLIAGATEAGGCIVAYDQDGKTIATLPSPDDMPDSGWDEKD
ncbi:MAG: hypothetical protein ABIT76_13475 [Chthoniobacterales bacterium]